MILDALMIVVFLLVGLYFLKLLTGAELFSALLTTPLEFLIGYRKWDFNEGVYNLCEAQELAKKLQPYFTAIIPVNVNIDKFGWEIITFDIVIEADTDTRNIELRKALSIETRNFIQQYHGFKNDDVFVTVLVKNTLVFQIACSPKAHELAQKLYFTLPSSTYNQEITETFDEKRKNI